MIKGLLQDPWIELTYRTDTKYDGEHEQRPLASDFG